MREKPVVASARTTVDESPPDYPVAYIPSDRRVALAAGAPLRDRVHGAALFADISGFTQLTEALAKELGPHRGAEVVTASLNRVFHEVIGELDRYGGTVIYFSGDAVTAWLDGDDGLRATAAAVYMQEAIGRVGHVTTPGGTETQLSMKVAVAVGVARRFLVGDPSIQLIDVLAGALVDELAEAEQYAEKGEILLAQSAIESLVGRVEFVDSRLAEESGRVLGVARGPIAPVEESPLPAPGRELTEDEVRPWLLPAVYDRLSTGRGEFLAELRPAVPIFVRFTGIDYDSDDGAIEKLDEFVRRSQQILSQYGGNVLQLTLGDKGAYLYGVVGAPLAHEDDAARAVAAALELIELESTTAAAEIQIGMTRGRLRSGTYGHVMRRTYCCLGNAVNLAARLMSKAPPGQIFVDLELRRAVGDAFDFERLDPIQVKGQSEPVRLFAVQQQEHERPRLESRYELAMVGRYEELNEIDDRLERALGGDGQVLGITAEAGMGKSRLVAEAVRGAVGRGVPVFVGECQAFGVNRSYFVWQDVWRGLLALDRSQPPEEQIRALERFLDGIDPELKPRLPLLGAVLGLAIPDSDLTRTFDAKLRKASLEDLLGACLRARARGSQLLIVLEDCHWLDPLSRDLLAVLARETVALPVLILLAYRPLAEEADDLGVESLPHFRELPLARLTDEETELVIRAKAEQLFGAAFTPGSALVELVSKRAEGNPFYIEELLNYLGNQGIDPQDDEALRALQLPESLHSLILSRIDTLAEPPRRTLKVASVIGRLFKAPMLVPVYPDLGSAEHVLANLDTLTGADLVALDQEAEQAYLFKHAVTHEVTYESLPFAQRAHLHERVAGYIEENEETLERRFDLLAHHYWHSSNEPKKREYLLKAGEAAQREYANASAIDYFRRLVSLLPDGERGPVLLKLGKVFELIGDWDQAEPAYREALELAESLDDPLSAARAETAMGELSRKRGDYDEASRWLERAGEGFEALADATGMGFVFHYAGTVAAQQGDYETARKHYRKSLEIRTEVGDKAGAGSVYSNLAILAEYEGKYAEARDLHGEGLSLRTAIGDTWGIGVSENNIGNIARLEGDHDEARSRLEEALRLERIVGDSWMVALIENNLGNVTREQGDYEATRRHFRAALDGYRSFDDRWAFAFLLEDVASLAATVGDAATAVMLVAAATRLRDEIGVPRSPTDEEKLHDALAPARDSLDEAELTAAEAQGAGLGLDEALDEAGRLCESPALAAAAAAG